MPVPRLPGSPVSPAWTQYPHPVQAPERTRHPPSRRTSAWSAACASCAGPGVSVWRRNWRNSCFPWREPPAERPCHPGRGGPTVPWPRRNSLPARHPPGPCVARRGARALHIRQAGHHGLPHPHIFVLQHPLEPVEQRPRPEDRLNASTACWRLRIAGVQCVLQDFNALRVVAAQPRTTETRPSTLLESIALSSSRTLVQPGRPVLCQTPNEADWANAPRFGGHALLWDRIVSCAPVFQPALAGLSTSGSGGWKTCPTVPAGPLTPPSASPPAGDERVPEHAPRPPPGWWKSDRLISLETSLGLSMSPLNPQTPTTTLSFGNRARICLNMAAPARMHKVGNAEMQTMSCPRLRAMRASRRVRTRGWARTASGIPFSPGVGPTWRPSPHRPDHRPEGRVSLAPGCSAASSSALPSG